MQTDSLSIQERKRDLRFFALSLVAFVLIGIVNTLLGPILPALSALWNLDYTEAGYLFTTQFAGSITGAAASGILMKKTDAVRLITFGLILMAASIVCISLGGRWTGTAAVFCSGITLGITIPIINLSVAEMYEDRRAEALNVLNFAWGIGAMSAPLLIARFANGINITLPVASVSVLLIAVAIFLSFARPVELGSMQASAEPVSSDDSQIWKSPDIWLGLLFIFVYVGVETATGGWLASYARSLDTDSDSSWAMVQSLFWTGLLLGRIIAPFFLRFISGARLVMTGAVIAVAGIVIILTGASVEIISTGAAIAGFGMAPIFPTTLALLTERLGRRASQVTGYLFVAAGLGGAGIPWVVGFASNRYGNLRTGLTATLVGAISLIVLQTVIIARLRHSEAK